MFDYETYPFIFSASTRLARSIDNNYYGEKHYVWAALKFDSLKEQAAGSNPMTIAKRFIEEVYSEDGHGDKIIAHIVALKKGAAYMLKNGKIDVRTKRIVDKRINAALNDDFLPLIYVVDTKKVESVREDRIEPVPMAKAAKDKTPEYRIYDLAEDECEVIDLGAIIDSLNLVERGIFDARKK